MATKIFINLPVKDLDRTSNFFINLDFRFDSLMTDDNATCMIVEENIFVMFLTDAFFKTFTHKEVVDATKGTEVILSISVDTKEEVIAFIEKAVSLGATTPNKPQDHGFMYQWGFQDLDGHLWEIIYMDPNATMQ